MIQKNWQQLIKPTKLDIVPGTDPERTATLVAEPLERGFGLTLGNALRRVLLSSLHGAAVLLWVWLMVLVSPWLDSAATWRDCGRYC